MAKAKAPKRKPAKPAPAKRPPGRPSKRSPAIEAEICARLATGETLTSICRDVHMPEPRTVSDWTADSPAFAAEFARARETGFDAIADEAMRIADTPLEGVRSKTERIEIDAGADKEGGKVKVPGTKHETYHEDMLGHRKLQVETRLKLLAKWHPKKYGDKLEIAGDKDRPISVSLVNF